MNLYTEEEYVLQGSWYAIYVGQVIPLNFDVMLFIYIIESGVAYRQWE